MRLVQVTIPVGKREAVIDRLEGEDIDYILTDETSHRDYAAVAYFPLPTSAVEEILDDLRDAGLGDDCHMIVLDAEVDLSRKFQQLEERFPAENGNQKRIAREEIHTKAKEMAPNFGTYVALTVISAIVATAGLLVDSPAIVVGSMVIAPLIGPSMGASVGTVLDDADMFRKAVKLQLIGIGVAILSATLFAILVKVAHLVPPGIEITAISQISGRLSPDFLSLAVALGAGAAGVLSLSTGVSVALVGVMIAAALIPPAATVGIGIAWGLPMVALTSSVLVLINVLSVNLAGLVVLRYMGYRPKNWFRTGDTRSATVKRIGVLVVGIVLLSLFLGGATYASIQNAALETTIQNDIEATLDQPRYEKLTLLDTQVNYSARTPFHEPEQVIVTVGRPPGTSYPQLAERLSDRIDDHTERGVSIQIRFIEIERAD